MTGNGFVAGEPKSIMIGEATLLDTEVPLPPNVLLRWLNEAADMHTTSAMQDRVFGDAVSDERVTALPKRPASDDGLELWVEQAGGQIVSARRARRVLTVVLCGFRGF